MISFMKKCLLFLSVLVVASLLFSGNAEQKTVDSATEVVEIIDRNPSSVQDGYVEVPKENNRSSNFFVEIIRIFSNFIKAIFSAFFTVISKLMSGFAG